MTVITITKDGTFIDGHRVRWWKFWYYPHMAAVTRMLEAGENTCERRFR